MVDTPADTPVASDKASSFSTLNMYYLVFLGR